MNKKNIIYCSINSHFFEHGRALQIYSRLSGYPEFKIFWVDPPGFIHTYILSKFKKPFNKFNDNLDFITTIGFPKYSSSNFFWALSEKLLSIYLNKRKLSCDLLIISHPIFANYAKTMQKKGIPVIYDCRDFFSKWGHVCKYAIENERKLLQSCNFVIVPTKSLKKELLNLDPSYKIFVIYNGVPESMIKKCKKNNLRPKIGFIGHFGYGVDIDLIFSIAQKKSNWDFIFVGNYSNIKYKVKNAPLNCTFMGEVPFDQLDPILCSFDVALIPFQKIEINEVVFPVKLVEYFAKGIPTVSTPLNELLELERSSLIHFATDEEDWILKIEEALEDTRNEEFIHFARGYTWEDLTKKYINLFKEVL